MFLERFFANFMHKIHNFVMILSFFAILFSGRFIPTRDEDEQDAEDQFDEGDEVSDDDDDDDEEVP